MLVSSRETVNYGPQFPLEESVPLAASAALNRVGAGLTRPLPHHRTCGLGIRRFTKRPDTTVGLGEANEAQSLPVCGG